MKKERTQVTVLILENRQMIAAILSDVLEGSKYRTRLFYDIAAAQQALQQHLPALLLVDIGMIRPQQHQQWEDLQGAAQTLQVPVIPFSCSSLPARDDILVLRSPGDFAMVLEKVEEELLNRYPLVGMILARAGLLTPQEVETVVLIQRELTGIGRRYSLGDLLVRLDFVSREDLESALQEEEP